MIVHPILLQCQAGGSYEPTYEIFVEKTLSDPDYEYSLGETVTFTVTAYHTYDSDQTITLDEISDVTLSQSVFYDVPHDQVVTATATHDIVESDIINGSFTNTVTATVDGDSETATCDALTVPCEAYLTVELNFDSDYSELALGEAVPIYVSVVNTGNVTVTNITVQCDLTRDRWTINSLAPGEDEDFSTEYTATEDDIINGSVLAEAVVDGTSPCSDEALQVEPGEAEVATEPCNGHLMVTVTPTTQYTEPLAYDDQIDFVVEVQNDGNLTITSITVESARAGEVWTIPSLAPQASIPFSSSVRVDSSDIVAGELDIDGTARGTSPDPDETSVPVTSDMFPIATEASAPSLSVTMASIPAGPYNVGETITATLTVENTGNIDVSNITLTSVAFGNSTVTSSYFRPGWSTVITRTHTVTFADATAGYIDIDASVSGSTIDPAHSTVTASATIQRVTCQYVLSYKVNTEATTSGAKRAAIPFNLYNITSTKTMTVDWGDGTTSALKAADYTSSNGASSIHTYTNAGVYTIRITYDGDWTSTTLGWYATSTDLTTTYNNRNEFIAVFIQTLIEVLTPLPPIGIIRYYSNASPTGNPSTKSNAVSHMFRYCKKLTTIPANLFILNGGVTAAEYTFNNCQALAAVPAGLLDPLTLVTSMASMFTSCKLVTTIPSGFLDKNTAVTSINNLFYGCEALTAIPAHLLDKLVSLSTATNLFYGCKLVTTIPTDFLKFNTALTNVGYMFYNCYDITDIPIDLFRYNTRITNFQYAFRSCNALTTLPTDIFKYNTAATNLKNTFYSCTNLGNFDIHIGSTSVSSGNAANFVSKKTGATRTVRVPSGSTTQTTFNSVASSLGLTIVGE